MKRAIVIGATSGIGREVSRLLLAEGWLVGVAARRIGLLQELKSAAPSAVTIMQTDVTKEDAPKNLLRLAEQMGGVDLFFYAAGIGKQNMELDSDIETGTVDTNVTGFTRMIGTIYNYMADNGGGHIAVISSIAGTKGLGAAPSYSATKAYQSTYIQALEQQANMRGLKIRFTDIRPGFVDTPLLSGSGHYPMQMSVESVAREIMSTLKCHRHVRIIDWRYRLLVAVWRLLPGWIWRNMKITG